MTNFFRLVDGIKVDTYDIGKQSVKKVVWIDPPYPKAMAESLFKKQYHNYLIFF